MPSYNNYGLGIQWILNNTSGDQIVIGGGGGGIKLGGSKRPNKSDLTKIIIPSGTKKITVNGNRYEIDGNYYTDGTYEID